MANHSAQLNSVFNALADPTRRAIVMRLCQSDASVGELAKPFDMALPSLMKHVRILESCGLVETEKIGRVRTCAHRLKPLNHGSPCNGRSGNDAWIAWNFTSRN
jgi:DNA-binding transcriptional ArsR family regulator